MAEPKPSLDAGVPYGGVRLPARRKAASVRAVLALILREMSTSYGRSPGGYIWTIIEPVGGVLVLSFVFSFLLRSPPLGSSFLVFYATGMLPFLAYSAISNKIAAAIQFSKPLLAYPSVTYIDALVARLVLETMTQLIVGLLIFTFILTWTQEAVSLDFGAIGLACLMIVALGVGIGLTNSFLNSMFPIWTTLWAVLNRPLFLISGIFFLVEPLPEKFRDILLYNPLVHIISTMRSGFYATYDAPYASPAYVFTCAIIPAALGMLLLHRYHKDILEI
ncbi:ABC transporter permease [Sulfitobacter sp. F26169L]|uniref:ABC transporter permease n=1 Tax=Sulfitobacter sp. F26169L TaxID=2996015 RepID=UPI002260887C|nr:ABC transporter permease [Sulfitobacter sp. F26169L]MCX7568052.1 ABC transporter permease [Sulfitobacter sp. F26169L]